MGKQIGVSLAAAVAAGLAVGAIAGFVGQFFHLIILFPLAMGMAVSMAVRTALTAQKLREVALAAAIGLVGGTTAWSVDMGMRYLREREAVSAQLQAMLREEGADLTQLAPEQLEAMVDQLLIRMGGATAESPAEASRSRLRALLGWAHFRAANTTLSRRGSTSDPIPKPAAFLLWFVEWAIISGMAAAAGVHVAQEPYCEACDQFYGKVAVIPFAPENQKERVVSALQAGDGQQLAGLFTPDVSYSPVVLGLRQCCAQSPLHVVATHLKPKKGKDEHESKRLWSGYLPASVFAFLRGPGPAT